MIKYLDGETLTTAEILRGLRAGTVGTKLVPVLCGSALKNKGVQPMLDAVVDFLPSPLDRPSVEGAAVEGETAAIRNASDSEPFAALAFKIATDPFVGKLTFFRVYSGVLRSGSYVYNATKGERERVGRLLQMHANHREEIEEVRAGDIAAAIGLRKTTTGDTLCDEKYPIVLEQITFPEPVISVAVEPKTKAEQDKMGIALQKLAEEDPTFRVRTDEETGQTVISGMGELHLEIIVDRMLREFKVDATVGKPQVSYRETITAKAHGTGRFVRQSGGHGQYGHVELELEPNPGKGFEFVSKIVGGSIPREYIAPSGRGIADSLSNGVLAGYPVVDIKVTLVDGSYHDVDSSEQAFNIAGSMGFKDGDAQGEARAARADHACRRLHARGVHGRRDGRSLRAPRSDPRHGRSRGIAHRARRGAAGDDVRLRRRPAQHDPGQGQLQHGVPSLSAASREPRRRARRQSQGLTETTERAGVQ